MTGEGYDNPSSEPAKCYLDVPQSFASNEVAINQQAALVFLLGFIEKQKFLP